MTRDTTIKTPPELSEDIKLQAKRFITDRINVKTWDEWKRM